MTALMRLENVSRSFRKGKIEVPVLQEVNLEVDPLKFLCLVGESGCGKTTTGKILAGLLPPSAGQIYFQGDDVATLSPAALKEYRRSVQIIHQDPYASLNPVHTIDQMLSFPLLHHKLVRNRRHARERVAELLELVDLTPVGDVIDKYPYQLSGGQRQRVSIARALTTNPSLIVADESVSMVDVSIRIGLLQMMMRLRDELGVTIVFITHDLALAKYFAWEGQIAVMYLGRIVEVGPTPELIAQPQHPYTQVLLSAIPEPDPEKTRSKQHIRLRSEDIPKLTELPSGCTFHPRCPWFAPGVCDQAIPQLGRSPGHQVQVACAPLLQGQALRRYGSSAEEDGA